MRRERLTAQAAKIDPFVLADFDGVSARRLPADGMNPGRVHFNILAIFNESAEKPFRNGTATDISGADKKDAFHR